MVIDEIKRQMFIDSEEVCGNTMIDTYQAQEYVEQAYNKAIDDFIHECDKYCGFYSGKNKNIIREDILKIAEQLKTGGEYAGSI